MYSQLGISIMNKTDFINYSHNEESNNNALFLLITLGFVSIENNNFVKILVINDSASFYGQLIDKIYDKLNDTLKNIFNCHIFLDVFKKTFYINRNSIKLEFSGLIMLLTDLGILNSSSNRLYILDEKLLDILTLTFSDDSKNIKGFMSPDLLDSILALEKKFGEDAENQALLYESQRLKTVGINDNPIKVSSIDCKAGFDILSYDRNNKIITNRYIEVKSVNESMRFYISKNEIECSKIYGEAYFIYLFNRTKREFVIIKNPYKEIFSDNKWIKTPELFSCEINEN